MPCMREVRLRLREGKPMRKVLTNIIVDWGIRAFGCEHMRDPRVRALRLAEETIELAQALDVPRSQLRDRSAAGVI